jgi:hypothetical protein
MKVGIITGKFKPPHAGHYKTILGIANLNDETHVFVSPREEGGITGEQSVRILKNYFGSKSGVKIKLAEVSPVKTAYDFIEALGKSDKAKQIDLRVYGLEDDLSRFSSLEKFKGNMKSAERVETDRPKFDSDQAVSGTLMRKFLKAGDKASFIKGLPDVADGESVWRILGGEANENMNWRIPADSFNQQIDPNIMPTDINTQVGGLPAHWTTSQPYSRFDLKTNPLADRYGRNPKSRAVKTFAEFCQGMDSNK